MVGVAAQVPIATRERSVPVSQGCTGPTAVSLAACVAALLCAQPTSAYRTAGDLPEFADTETVAWVDGVVRYELNERLPQGLALEAVETAVLGAFHSWSEPACSGLLVHYSGLVSDDAAPGDGRNTVQWVYSGWADLGFAQDAPGATDIQYERDENDRWTIVEADIYLNAETFSWRTGTGWGTGAEDLPGGREIPAVVTHEAGHVVGLLHPCELGGADGAPACEDSADHAGSAMYPEYSANQVYLSADDTDAVCFLYPAAASCAVATCPEGWSCTVSGCSTVCGDDLCTEQEQCTQDGCTSLSEDCLHGTCNAPLECERRADCPSPMVCIEGECTRGIGALGDPCVHGLDCYSGGCSADGYCALVCSSDDDCGPDEACDDREAIAVCVGDRKPFAAPCDDVDDCIGGKCLAGASATPMCSRTCGPSDPECPGNWECGTVAGESVCIPPELETGWNCGVSGQRARRNEGDVALACLALTVAVALRMHRRRRSGAPSRGRWNGEKARERGHRGAYPCP
jgi:hypothetical protein